MVEAPAAHHIEYQRWGIHELVLRRTAMSSGAPPLPPDASCPFGKVKACYQGPLQEAWNPIPRIQFLAVKHACVGWTLACSEKSHGSIKPRSWLCKDDLE